jgi:hypothetical protein
MFFGESKKFLFYKSVAVSTTVKCRGLRSVMPCYIFSTLVLYNFQFGIFLDNSEWG